MVSSVQMNSMVDDSLTDHANTENHEIDWDNAKVIDRWSQKRRQHIKEAIWIKRTEGAINWDEGNYQLFHLYQTVIHHGIHLYWWNHPVRWWKSLHQNKGKLDMSNEIYLYHVLFLLLWLLTCFICCCRRNVNIWIYV